MNAVAGDHENTFTLQADTVLIEKVRWSLRQRLRKQMHELSGDFFDEVDDFLFSSGQQGQFSDHSVYLKSMREVRAKQAHFEGLFLDNLIRHIKNTYNNSDSDRCASPAAEGDAVYEKVEVDLALSAMARKADKAYAQLIKQIESVQVKTRQVLGVEVVGSRVVLDAILEAFAETHRVFSVPLEVRLVLIKLFEQHFVLKLEKCFLDIISIISHAADEGFVARLYSSSSAFRARQSRPSCTVMNPANSVIEQATNSQQQNPQAVETAVEQFLASLCSSEGVPGFVNAMLQRHWRAVLFVIGLNRGTESLEWGEAKHTASMLVTAVSSGLASLVDVQALTEQLRKGFNLIQLDAESESGFLKELEQQFQSAHGTPTDAQPTRITRDKSNIELDQEAAVTPCGESILDQDDLDEIARLLGDNSEPEDSLDLSQYLHQVDSFAQQLPVDFLLNGSYAQCLLRKSPGNAEMFTITRQGAQISVTRSRLGLALALQSGEMRLTGHNLPIGERTLIDSAAKTCH